MKRYAVGIAAIVVILAGCTSSKAATATAGGYRAAEASAAQASKPADRTPMKTMTLSGSGDDVIDVSVPADDPVLATISNSGSDNFIVKSSGRDRLIVNTIGSYKGRHLLNLSGDLTELEVQSDGKWTVTIEDYTKIRRGGTSASGTGDDVVYIETDASRAKLTHGGEENFVVHSVFDGRLLVNEIGTYSGTVRVSLPNIITINADGKWSIEAK